MRATTRGYEMSKLVRAGVAALMLALVVPLYASTAEAGPAACESRNNNTAAKLLECVTLAGVREHQAAFQAIADANGGNRFSGLPGHDASVDYVVDRLEAAGYDPVVQPFDYLAFTPLGASALQQTAPGQVTYVEDVDFGVIDQSDPGDVTAAVTPVDLQLGLGNTTTSGCEAGGLRRLPRREHRPAPAGQRARSRSRPRTPPPPVPSAS